MERVSILLVNYNRLEYLRGTVESIYETTGIPYELIIWDNASTEPEMKEYLTYLSQGEENYTRVIFSPENVGVWKASNRLIAEANNLAELGFVKFDNDVIMKTKGWLQKWIECCQANPEVGMIGANIERKKERSYDTEVLELNGHPLLSLTKEGTGGLVYVPGSTFKRLGYYNEEYGRYGQGDKDYAKRVMLDGKKFVYHREVEVDRFAVNTDDNVGGYREHKNNYVRRNRRLYFLNRHLYQRKLRSRGIWYERYPVPEEAKANPGFVWSSTGRSGRKVRWDNGTLTNETRAQLEQHRLMKVRK